MSVVAIFAASYCDGDEIAKKVFPPNNECPQFTFQRKDERKKDSSKPTRKIEAWLRTQAKR